MLFAVHNLYEEKETIWPEIARLVLVYRKNNEEEDFGVYAETMETILGKLVGITLSEYNTVFTYEEKIVLLTVLVDGIHDLTDFRNYLNKRIEEKSVFNREKMEVYT